jgi:hypothetical protein
VSNYDIVSLDWPFRVSAATSFLELYIKENGSKKDYVEFLGWFQKENKEEGIRVTFERCIGGKMGSLAESDIDTSVSIGEVIHSPWLEKIRKVQRERYGSDQNFKDMHHYFFHGHDADVEIIAEKIHWEILDKAAVTEAE